MREAIVRQLAAILELPRHHSVNDMLHMIHVLHTEIIYALMPFVSIEPKHKTKPLTKSTQVIDFGVGLNYSLLHILSLPLSLHVKSPSKSFFKDLCIL